MISSASCPPAGEKLKSTRIRCLHCQHRPAYQEYHKGLCQLCYQDRAIRDSIPNRKRQAPIAAQDRPCYRCGEHCARACDRYLCDACRAERRKIRGRIFGTGLGKDLEDDPGPRTDAMPGTDEKIKVLSVRAAQCRSLWNDLDGLLDYE
jgi:hypothetical protein